MFVFKKKENPWVKIFGRLCGFVEVGVKLIMAMEIRQRAIAECVGVTEKKYPEDCKVINHYVEDAMSLMEEMIREENADARTEAV